MRHRPGDEALEAERRCVEIFSNADKNEERLGVKLASNKAAMMRRGRRSSGYVLALKQREAEKMGIRAFR